MSDEKIDDIIKKLEVKKGSVLEIFEAMVTVVLTGFKANKVNRFTVKYFEKSVDQIRQLIQQKPKIDGAYIQGKTLDLIEIITSCKVEEAMSFIKSIISEVQGREREFAEVVKDALEKESKNEKPKG